jgi:Tfp pilus assembly protein PilN
MHTINLLAPARLRRRPKPLLLTVGAVAVSVVLVAFIIWSSLLITHVNHLRRDVAAAAQQAAQLRPITRHVQELSQDAERLRLRRALLLQVLTPQLRASQILETTRSLVPHDVWLTTLTAGSDATFEGYTFSYPSIARFMVELEGSGNLRHVDLSMSQSEIVIEREVVKFRITGDLVGAPPVTSQKETTP